MYRTEAILRKWLAALPAPAYELGILGERGMYRLEAVPSARILRMLPYLKRRDANGAHIYGRPTGESPYTLLDDANPATLDRLTAEGFAPAAVVETSPGNFQAWLRHHEPLPKELGTLAAQCLQNGSTPTATLPTGAGSDGCPALPTGSRSTGTVADSVPELRQR